MDFKDKIISELTIILDKEKQSGNSFKIRAYQKVLPELKNLEAIHNLQDIEGIQGIGKGIKDRIKEIIETGELQSAEKIKNDPKIKIIEDFMKIYGVGPVKANELYETNGMKSIEQIKTEGEKYLNEKQKIGLKHYEDLKERIPRSEMKIHEKVIKKFVARINPNLIATIVGSYRRENPDSGDIDVLISYKEGFKDVEEAFKNIIKLMKESNYIIDILATGSKKCLAISSLNEVEKGKKKYTVVRRLDLLLTKPEEYPYALLYFTGSDKFNIEMRKKALQLGYSLNEHTLKFLNSNKNKNKIPDMETEEDVFKFLDMSYLEPNKR